jgi:hypothetical protein
MTSANNATTGITERRKLYAERCANLMQALEFQRSILLGGPPDGPVVTQAVAKVLSETLGPDSAEDLFARVDAMWAAWVRPGAISSRYRETIEHNARMVILACVRDVLRVHELVAVIRAVARDTLGRLLGDDERRLLNDSDAPRIREAITAGAAQIPLFLAYGVPTMPLGSAEEIADRRVGSPTELLGLLPVLVETHGGYRAYAERITPELSERLLSAWGLKGERKWNELRAALWEIAPALGETSTLRKDWEAFCRGRGLVLGATRARRERRR